MIEYFQGGKDVCCIKQRITHSHEDDVEPAPRRDVVQPEEEDLVEYLAGCEIPFKSSDSCPAE